jgi:hypothetical protein
MFAERAASLDSTNSAYMVEVGYQYLLRGRTKVRDLFFLQEIICRNFIPDQGFLPSSSGFLGVCIFPYSNQPHTEYPRTNLKRRTPFSRHAQILLATGRGAKLRSKMNLNLLYLYVK